MTARKAPGGNHPSPSDAVALIDKLAQTNDHPEFQMLVALARRAVHHLKPALSKSEQVTQRQNALVEAYRELSPKLQDLPTGRQTVERLRAATIAKLGLADADEVISEDTIRKDVQLLGPVFRLIRMGVITSLSRPAAANADMDGVRRRHARLGGRNYSEQLEDGHDPNVKLPDAVRRAATRSDQLHADAYRKRSG